MDVLKRIDEIIEKTTLKIDYSDFPNCPVCLLLPYPIMRKRNTIPSIATLEYICDSFDMTLSQFFVDEGTLLYPVMIPRKIS